MKQETTSSAKQYLPALIWCALAVLADQFTKWLGSYISKRSRTRLF